MKQRIHVGSLVLAAPLALLLTGGNCTENNINKQPIREIAVVTGDFDNMAENLDRMLLSYQVYEGFICCASYDFEVDPESNVLDEESLFGLGDGSGEDLFLYDAVFLNSGARGWGQYQYNGIEEDSSLLTNEDTLGNIYSFVEGGGLLILSDWTYDVIEALWPEMVQFYDEADGVPDSAQVGLLGEVQAKVVDALVAERLDEDEVTLSYNYSNWTVIEDVDDRVDVILQGDIEYRVSASEGTGVAQDVPLLFAMDVGAGQVIFSSFHWNAQTPDLADRLMMAVAPGLRTATGGEE